MDLQGFPISRKGRTVNGIPMKNYHTLTNNAVFQETKYVAKVQHFPGNIQLLPTIRPKNDIGLKPTSISQLMN